MVMLNFKFTKRLIALACAGILFIYAPLGAIAVEECIEASGNNLNDNDYVYNWSTVRNSFLEATDDGVMKLQSGAVEGKYLAEYYNSDYSLTKSLLIDAELPMFGGFYKADNNYYILSGQSNPEESDSVEVFRITKYDLNWNRLGSAGIFGGNTTLPFEAGNARFAHEGKYLIIRTAHEMYAIDGLCHQANVTIQVDTDTMTVTDQLTDVWNEEGGYVSHSFNQFLHIDDGKIVALDHGDAYPRSIVLIKYPTKVSEGSFFSYNCQAINLVNIPGEIGENYTGIELGGFEIAKENYLAAYSSVDLSKALGESRTKNIYVTAVSKATNEITHNKITNYPEGETGTDIPQLVKINDEFALLWTCDQSVYYTKVNGNGEAVEPIRCMKSAHLSDCEPIIYNGKILWYTYNGTQTNFYSIDTTDFTKTQETVVFTGHNSTVSAYPDAPGGDCYTKCAKCGAEQSFKTGEYFVFYWKASDDYYVSSSEINAKVGDSLPFIVDDQDESLPYNDKVVEISDESAVDFYMTSDDYGYLKFHKPGIYRMKIYYKYNPSVYYKYTLYVADENGNMPESDVLGDVNASGALDSMDYVLVKRAYFGTYAFNEDETVLGDVNKNGEIDSMDYVLIKRAYFGTYSFN